VGWLDHGKFYRVSGNHLKLLLTSPLGMENMTATVVGFGRRSFQDLIFTIQSILPANQNDKFLAPVFHPDVLQTAEMLAVATEPCGAKSCPSDIWRIYYVLRHENQSALTSVNKMA
jgi:hypothetical protein